MKAVLISHKGGGFIDGSDVIHKDLEEESDKNLREILEGKKTAFSDDDEEVVVEIGEQSAR